MRLRLWLCLGHHRGHGIVAVSELNVEIAEAICVVIVILCCSCAFSLVVAIRPGVTYRAGILIIVANSALSTGV